jgi:hypothetical protein
MRHVFAAAFMILASTAAAQAQTASNDLEFGSVRLTIGMTRDAVKAAFLDTQYNVQEIMPGSLVIISKYGSSPHRILGSMSFVDNRLVLAQKDWSPQDQNSAIDTASKIYAAVEEFTEHQPLPCTVSTGHQATPQSEEKAVFIKCGSTKYLTISALKVEGVEQNAIISETIKQIPKKN